MKNSYEIRGDVTAIFLTRRNGTIIEATVDTGCLPKLLAYKGTWSLSHGNDSHPRVHMWNGIQNVKQKFLYLHRVVLDAPDGLLVDHINGNTLDNTMKNLRLVDQKLNMQNIKGASKNSRSGHLGVYWNKNHNKWAASFRNKHLGYFDDIEVAVNTVKSVRAQFAPYSKEARTVKEKIDVMIPEQKKAKKQSGVRGITWCARHSKWKLRVTIGDKRHSFGYYRELEDAIAVYNTKKDQL